MTTHDMDTIQQRYKRSDFELMAPVGSYESLHAAIDAGADAVYLGLGTLNMRARSSVNFTTDDLRSITDTCRQAGVKVYLTLNTVLYRGRDIAKGQGMSCQRHYSQRYSRHTDGS